VGRNLPIDTFLQSLAEDRGSKAIGIILSGTASDGAEGVRAIKVEGGITFAQDEASAKYTGMPRTALATGCVDFVLPPPAIARELAQISRHPYVNHRPEAKPGEMVAGRDDELAAVFRLLLASTGVDFSHYKPNTIQRRIHRRMAL